MTDQPDIPPLRLCLAARTPSLGAGSLAAIIATSPDLELLERPDVALLAQLGLTTSAIGWLRAPDHSRLDADLRWLETADCALLPATSPAYPDLLRQSPDAPAVLWVRGNLRSLAEPQLAM